MCQRDKEGKNLKEKTQQRNKTNKTQIEFNTVEYLYTCKRLLGMGEKVIKKIWAYL